MFSGARAYATIRVRMLRELHTELGIPEGYADRMPRYAEASGLVDAGVNIVARPIRLDPAAREAWLEMSHSALGDGVTLLSVSGFRSYDDQARLIRKKLNRGEAIADILGVDAAPGHSEHHTGRAIDVASPGSRPLTEDFEASEAFGWLSANAGRFGFSLSYPRGNLQGLIYSPWHWMWRPV